MRKKLFVIALILVLAVVVPLVVAQIVQQQNQTIHVSGTAKYPRNISTSTTPTPAVAASVLTPTVQFALFFPNGTSCPTTLTNLPCNIYGPLDSIGGIPATTQLLVKNTGTVPINITFAASNVQVPSNINFNLAGDVEFNPIAPGGTTNLYLAINMVTTNTNFVAGAPLSYSFDVTIAATQA
jgi:hypothetical protein